MNIPQHTPEDSHSPSLPIKWLRDKQAVAIYNISRTKLWQLQRAGKIRSVSLTEPGMARATRLFEAKSIEAYIESFLPENQQTKAKAK
ncbi:helix-turn-helix domain-containing protein [bacterium]|nr:helix-turn-helix domain-containing protein [bacterium]